jgi:hypothetical protein
MAPNAGALRTVIIVAGRGTRDRSDSCHLVTSDRPSFALRRAKEDPTPMSTEAAASI